MLISSVCFSKPVYLECRGTENGSKRVILVKFDEENGKITHTFSDGAVFNTEGFFSANEITYVNSDGHHVRTINRTTLLMTSVYTLRSGEVLKRLKNQCQIISTEGRKI